jgi:DNA-binding NtrC family response regulator
VTIAGDAESMRIALTAGGHDAVVLDVRLPGPEDGLTLARFVADYGCGVVLITGDHRLERALAESGYRYLLKPFRVEQLRLAIREAIRDTHQGARRGATE